MNEQVISDALWVDDGDYFILRNGRIFKKNWENTGKTREVKQSFDKDGYLIMCYKGKTVRSHRLIAKAFISNPDNLPQVNHKSEIKDSNFVTNLEWCDARYNINYGTCKERISKARINGKGYVTVP